MSDNTAKLSGHILSKQEMVDKYYRRLERDEFAAEMRSHMIGGAKAINREKAIAAMSETKADYYTKGNEELDAVAAQLKLLADALPEGEEKAKLETSLKKLEDASKCFSVSALVQNNTWGGFYR